MTSFALDLTQQYTLIEHWFSKQWQQTPPPFYTSVDLRENAFELAPVDTNLFPAGFNNLAPENVTESAESIKKTLAQYPLESRRILILSEHHTHNLFYLDNLLSLQNLLKNAGYEVRLGTLPNGPSGVFYTHSKEVIQLDSVMRTENQLHIEKFIPDLVLLNNDLATGIPPLLEGLSSIFPPLHGGWHQRLKSHHFYHYARICKEFSAQFHLDVRRFDPLFRYCEGVNFTTRAGFSSLRIQAEELLHAIQEKYEALQIHETPYLVIKADAGSYGMGVLMIEHPDELEVLSRKKRQHMAKTKGNRVIQRVILQEGIVSTTQIAHEVAEPVIYLIGAEVIGGFYRTHATRNPKENLNTPGMQLQPFVFKKFSPHSYQDLTADSIEVQHYAYSVIARLAALAASYELNQ